MNPAGAARQIDAGSAYGRACAHLKEQQYHWLITGVAGFIGSHLLETLLGLGQRVTGLDNFLTGYWDNLAQVRRCVSSEAWKQFRFIEGDIRSPQMCALACQQVDFVLHQAALGSVARSIEDPVQSADINMIGFLCVLTAARKAGVRRVVYAASSASYGDHPDLPKVEDRIGRPLSPYAASKYVNELFADVFARCYQSDTIGLRYFNIFGPRQDPNGAYAAVIPQWVAAMLTGRAVTIHGDGQSSRDFCYVDNAVQANILASLSANPAAANQVFNIAVNDRTTLAQLHALLADTVEQRLRASVQPAPLYAPFRPGDVRHSQADISKARNTLGYVPTHRIADGIAATIDWHIANLK